MDKDKIIAICKEHNSQQLNYEEIKKMSVSSIISNSHRFSPKDLAMIISERKETLTKSVNGWQLLHYVCLSNKPDLFEVALRAYTNEVSTSIPSTTKEKFKVAKDSGICEICVIHDCDKILAKFITCLKSPEQLDWASLLTYALIHKNSNVSLLLNKIIGDESQNLLLHYYNSSYTNDDGNRKQIASAFISKAICYNVNNFKKFGIDIHHQIEHGHNYLTRTLEELNSNFYKHYYYSNKEENNIKIRDFFHKCLSFFMQEGFNLDDKDNLGVSARSLLHSLYTNIPDEDLLNKMKLIEKKWDIYYLTKKIDTNIGHQNKSKKLKI